MPTEIGAEKVQELVGEEAQLIEVLPAKEYEEEHLPGARNIPLKTLTWGRAGDLDRARPVVVYCWDDA